MVNLFWDVGVYLRVFYVVKLLKSVHQLDDFPQFVFGRLSFVRRDPGQAGLVDREPGVREMAAALVQRFGGSNDDEEFLE